MKKPKTNTQAQRFIDKARELGCDEDEAAFEKRLRKIATAPPPAPGKEEAPPEAGLVTHGTKPVRGLHLNSVCEPVLEGAVVGPNLWRPTPSRY